MLSIGFSQNLVLLPVPKRLTDSAAKRLQTASSNKLALSCFLRVITVSPKQRRIPEQNGSVEPAFSGFVSCE